MYLEVSLLVVHKISTVAIYEVFFISLDSSEDDPVDAAEEVHTVHTYARVNTVCLSES